MVFTFSATVVQCLYILVFHFSRLSSGDDADTSLDSVLLSYCPFEDQTENFRGQNPCQGQCQRTHALIVETNNFMAHLYLLYYSFKGGSDTVRRSLSDCHKAHYCVLIRVQVNVLPWHEAHSARSTKLLKQCPQRFLIYRNNSCKIVFF